MTWNYLIEWHDLPIDNYKFNPNPTSIVMVSSKPRSKLESDLIKIEPWIEGNLLFVQLQIGQNPIIGAKVMIYLTPEITSGNSDSDLVSMKLYDDGFGDPDILQGDGIYTRYLNRLSPNIRYSVQIHADDDENRAFFIKNNMENGEIEPKLNNLTELFIRNQRKCCGSTVLNHFENKKFQTIGNFKRIINGPSFHSEKKMENLPPGKIGDLRINILKDSLTPDKLRAEWTAPGGNFDFGSVYSYRFVFSSNIEDLIDPSKGDPKVLLGFDRIESEGTEAKFEFNFPHYDQDFYVGAYAFNQNGHRGKISNLVHINLPNPNIIGSNSVESIQSNNGSTSDLDWVVMGSICGVVSVLLILAIASISYYIYVSRKKSSMSSGSISSGAGGISSEETDSSSFDSDIKTIVTQSTLVQNQLSPQQLTRRQLTQHQLTATQTITNSSSSKTPVYWSATELLTKLEQSQHTQSLPISQNQPNFTEYHQQPLSLINNVPMWTYRVRDIPDEYTVTVDDSSTNDSKKFTKVPKPPRNITQV